MTGSFDQLNAVLHALWPEISKMEWTRYGEKIFAYDEDVHKYTGIISHFANGVAAPGRHTQVLGFLPRPEKSIQTVVRKVRILEHRPKYCASIEARDPEKGDWGGAIRSSLNPQEIYAVSGLPEIGDHLLVVEMLCQLGMLSRLDSYYLHAVNPAAGPIQKARDDVKMQAGAFNTLHSRLKKSVKDAVERIGLV
jgi:hypothetical protein